MDEHFNPFITLGGSCASANVHRFTRVACIQESGAVQCSAVAAKRCECRLITHMEHPLRWLDRGKTSRLHCRFSSRTLGFCRNILWNEPEEERCTQGRTYLASRSAGCMSCLRPDSEPQCSNWGTCVNTACFFECRLYRPRHTRVGLETQTRTVSDCLDHESLASRKLPCFLLLYARLLLMTAPPAGWFATAVLRLRAIGTRHVKCHKRLKGRLSLSRTAAPHPPMKDNNNSKGGN